MPLNAEVVLPGSKSLTNRALIAASLAFGESSLCGCLDADDTRVMIAALKKLGVSFSVSPANSSSNFAAAFDTLTINVCGCNGAFPISCAELDVAGSGTTIRFLTAVLAISESIAAAHDSQSFLSYRYKLFGTPRMHQRPMQPLLDALKSWGCVLTSQNGFPPIIIESPAPVFSQANSSSQTPEQTSEKIIRVEGNISSQFLSGLLLAAPLAARHFAKNMRQKNVRIEVVGNLVSLPYIRQTLAVMRAFGVEVEAAADFSSFTLKHNSFYRSAEYVIEPDASSASYFFAAAAICGGSIFVKNVSREMLQGDIAFVEILSQMGCCVKDDARGITVSRDASIPLRGVNVDMNAISDTALTLGVVALFAESPTTITGVAHMRHKETDRISALASELRKCGAQVEEFADGLTINPPQQIIPAKIETYLDHRMAMSFAILQLCEKNLIIKNPDCCRKTFPHFFETLAQLGAS